MVHHSAASTKDYWGYLIQQDKSPTPLLRNLLIGIAHYISRHVAPWEVKTLTPIKLANFYRLCGGNCDGLFLAIPNATVAFIYKSLGCYHSLQPSKDPFAAPTIPALTNDGFVKWQTVQLLLGPEEHVPFLQEAVKRFELKNPYDGEPFPRHLPAEALPRRADPEMTRWHEQVGRQLQVESEASLTTPRNEVEGHSRGLSDVESLTDSHTSTDDSKSIVDAADYFSSTRRPSSFGNSNATPMSPSASRTQHTQAFAQRARRNSVPDEARTPSQETASQQAQPPPQNFRRPSYDTPPESSILSESRNSQSPGRQRYPDPQGTPNEQRPAYQNRSRSHSHSPHPKRTYSHEQQSFARPQPLHQYSGDGSSRRSSAFVPPTYNREHLQYNSADPNRPYFTLSPQFYTPVGPGSRPVSQAGPGVLPQQPQVPPQQYQQGQPMPMRPAPQTMPQQGAPPPAGKPQQGMPPPQQNGVPLMMPRPQQNVSPPAGPPPPNAFARGQLRHTGHPQQRSRSSEASGITTPVPGVLPPGTIPTSLPPNANMPPVATIRSNPNMPPPAIPPNANIPPPAPVHPNPNSPPQNGVPPPQGVRFADEPPISNASRMRRRTMEEMARERERAERADMLDFEAGRRKARGTSGTRRSRSGDQREAK